MASTDIVSWASHWLARSILSSVAYRRGGTPIIAWKRSANTDRETWHCDANSATVQ